MSFWQNIFYNKSTRRLRQMLESVRMRDYSLQYSLKHLSGEERRMAEEINAVIRDLREAEHRREGESHLYEELLKNVSSLMIVTDEPGRVIWMNQPAIDRLCGFRIDTLEKLAVLHPSLPEKLRELRKGMNQLVSFTLPTGEERQYATSMSMIFVRGIAYKLYTLQSVAPIIKQGEVMAQQRLIRVLTHEIMNSLAPIVSLSETLKENLTSTTEADLSGEEMNQSLSTISRRANGLMQFVQRYRELSGIAMPVTQKVRAIDLMHDLKRLSGMNGVSTCVLDIDIQCGNASTMMDRAQMEQVMLNLVKNAMEAGATRVDICAKLSSDERWMIIEITDNGGGFATEIIDDLFTPFFTTKQSGQGIGLAVCRQIVSNHGGMIGAENVSGGARFTVRLPM